MPFTALVWNIEQFGTNFRQFADPLAMEDMRCQLIASVVGAAQADVLVIQELRQDGVPVLKQLVTQLNALPGGRTWHYDWLPGSQTVAVNAPTLFSQLGFTQAGSKEGYAAVWRDGALAPYASSTLSAGIDTPDPSASGAKASRGRYLDMVFSGKPLLFKDQNVDITFDPNGSLAPLGFPQPVCPERTFATTPSQSAAAANAVITQQLDVRRPCCVQLNVTPSRTVALVVLHAPAGQSNSRSPIYATLIGFAAQQLQGINSVADTVYAGNFNVVGQLPQQTLKTYPAKLGYVANTYSKDVPAPSVVGFLKSGGGFLTGDTVFGDAQDYGFAAAPQAAPTLSVRNVLDLDITADDGAIRETLTDVGDTMNATIMPGLIRVAGQDVADVFDDWINGQPLPSGADERTAAAIIQRIFISKHLPVAISYA
jgi:hypothetical protein